MSDVSAGVEVRVAGGIGDADRQRQREHRGLVDISESAGVVVPGTAVGGVHHAFVQRSLLANMIAVSSKEYFARAPRMLLPDEWLRAANLYMSPLHQPGEAAAYYL
ncbi:MAG: hypothetical protein AAF108_09780 [Planctomycetota bacterium]